MSRTLTKPTDSQSPVAADLRALGLLIRNRRAHSMLRIDDAAALVGVSKETLSRLENGRAVSTDKLMAVAQGLGLTFIVTDKWLASKVVRSIEEDAGKQGAD